MAKGLDIDQRAEAGKKELSSWQELVVRKVESLRYGFVQVIVYDGQVVQVERTERVRIAPLGKNATRYQE